VTGPNGSITTRTALTVNKRLGATESKIAEPVAPGVYALRGWGIAHSFAIEAPDGWIIVDTGDSTQVAAEMRETLEQAVGKKIKVAAILLTHWHYADGTAAWMDEGTELWGHEHLDRNRRASGGVSVLGGYLMSRATAQFGVFHPTTGPDAFPNALSFTPEKFLLVSSYQPPTKLFPDGKVIDLVIAGEPIQVAPSRTDVTDSVAFYFPQRRLMVTNFLVIDTIFNIYTLRGGAFRNPEILVGDARWVESKNAEILLDIHNPTLRGEEVVREALERSVDSIQLIHDQTLRLSPVASVPARRRSRSTCRATCARRVRATGRSRVTSGRSTTGTSAGSTATSTTSTRSRSKKKPSARCRRWVAARRCKKWQSRRWPTAGSPTGAGDSSSPRCC
jgi:hypothetical protein